MQANITSLSDVQQEADIEVTSEELQPHFERAYVKYRPKVELRGFRKGKVPMEMIKKLYGEAIEHDALETIAGEFYQQAMQEKNIQPLGQPSLIDMDFKRGERFKFKIKYEVRPVIELRKYKGVAVEKEIYKVTDEEVNAEIQHIRQANSTNAPANAVTDPEHIVTADVQELDETGTPLIGKKTAGVRFFLADPDILPEVKDALKNAEVGGVYRAKYETQHGDHTHSMNISMTVTAVEKVTLPPFDDELVKKITGGKVTSSDEFMKNLRADLERYWAEQSDRKLSDTLAAEVVREHEFLVPDTLVEGFLDTFVDDIKSKSRDKSLPRGFDEKKFRDESRSYAVWQAKWLLLKERIAEQEGLTVTDEDVEKLAEAEAARIGLPKEQLLQYYKKSSTVTERILSDKVMAFIMNNAKITEKVVEKHEH